MLDLRLATPAVAFLLFSQVAQAQDKAVAIGMILQANEGVQVQRATGKKPAKLGELLYPNDQVTTGSGDVLFVFCPTAERVILKSNASVQLTSQDIRVVRGAQPARQKASNCTLPQVALGAESMERIGALRARGYPPVLLYVGGLTAASRPRFRWEPIPDARLFHLTVRSESGAKVWEQETAETGITYPDTAPSLSEGTYQWEVRAEKDGKILAQQAASFEIKPDAELSGESANDEAADLTLATRLESAGYFAEAADHFRKIRAAHPDDNRLTRHLAWLYWKAGLVTAMNRELESLPPQER